MNSLNTVSSKVFALLLTVLFAQPIIAQTAATLDSCSLINNVITAADSVYERQNNLALNITLLESVCKLSNKCKDHENHALALTKLSVLQRDENNFHTYSRYIDSALYVSETYLDSFHYLFPYLYSELTDINRIKRLYKASNEAAIKGIQHSNKQGADLNVYLCNKLAENYISLGNYAKALSYLVDVETIIRNFDIDGYYVYNSYMIRAYCYEKMKSYEQVMEYYDKAEEVLLARNKTDEQMDLLHLWLDKAKFLIKSGDYKTSSIYIEKIITSNYKKNNYVNAELSYIRAQMKESKLESGKSIELLEQAIKYYRKIKVTGFNFDVKQSLAWEKMGDYLIDQNKSTSAIHAYKEGMYTLGGNLKIDSIQYIRNKDHVIRFISKMRNIHFSEKNYKKAGALEEKLLALTRYLSIQNSTASIKEFWASENLKLFENLIEESYTRNRFDQVFKLMEENKSNILLKDINADLSSERVNIPSDIILEGKKLEEELLYKQSQLLEIKTNEPNNQELLLLRKEISQLQLKIDSYKNKLEKDFPEIYTLNYKGLDLNVSRLQRTLDNKDLVIEYFIGDRQSYVAFLSRNNILVKKLEDVKVLKDKALSYYDLISHSSSNKLIETVSNSLLNNLGLNYLEEGHYTFDNITIIADDFLNNIPFGTLRQNDGSFLTDSHTISYQYSAKLSAILSERRQRKVDNDFIGYAYTTSGNAIAKNRSCSELSVSNLKCAQKELNSIQTSLEDKKVSLAHNLPSVLDKAQSTRILHLATHACLDNSNTDLSRIYFDETYLTNQELLVTDIPADLVVLSACETGFGDIVKGEGSMSLSKGFFHAGAKSTVVSLWSVDDCSTALLMKYFYEFLRKGFRKDKALQQAKLSYRKYANPDKLHPYYWAGFIIVGDTTAVWPAGIDWSINFVLLGVLLLGLFLFIRKFK